MKNIYFPIGVLALIFLAFSNRKTNIEPQESPKIDLTLEPVGTVNIDETPILEEYIQNSLKDPETNPYIGTIVSAITGAAIGARMHYVVQKKKYNDIRDFVDNYLILKEGTTKEQVYKYLIERNIK